MARTTSASREARHEPDETTTEQDLVAEDLIEEVSIDGMCGVYRALVDDPRRSVATVSVDRAAP